MNNNIKMQCSECEYYRGNIIYLFLVGKCIYDNKKKVTLNHVCENFERWK